MKAIYKNFATNSENELERLYALSFKNCALTISKMDTFKKAETASKVQTILDNLYQQASRYGDSDLPREEQIGPDIFQYIMQRIKHWEQIMYWLYEIDILMEETNLDASIREAEKRWSESGCDIEAERIRVKEVVDDSGVKQKKRVKVNVKDDLQELLSAKSDRGQHTQEIMDLAKELTAKFNK